MNLRDEIQERIDALRKMHPSLKEPSAEEVELFAGVISSIVDQQILENLKDKTNGNRE